MSTGCMALLKNTHFFFYMTRGEKVVDSVQTIRRKSKDSEEAELAWPAGSEEPQRNKKITIFILFIFDSGVYVSGMVPI